MTDFNLAVAPVVDDDDRMLGQITVDDVLELLLPSGWRRQYGMAAPECRAGRAISHARRDTGGEVEAACGMKMEAACAENRKPGFATAGSRTERSISLHQRQ